MYFFLLCTQVDINVVMGSGAKVRAPIVRNAAAKGLGAISKEMQTFRSEVAASTELTVGTFSIHDYGAYTELCVCCCCCCVLCVCYYFLEYPLTDMSICVLVMGFRTGRHVFYSLCGSYRFASTGMRACARLHRGHRDPQRSDLTRYGSVDNCAYDGGDSLL